MHMLAQLLVNEDTAQLEHKQEETDVKKDTVGLLLSYVCGQGHSQAQVHWLSVWRGIDVPSRSISASTR